MGFVQGLATALIAGVAWVFPQQWEGEGEHLFLLLGFLSVGLFHGSADLLLIRSLSRNQARPGWLFWFLSYLGMIALSALLLRMAPQLLLSVFLVLSAFHFGESQFWTGRLVRARVPGRERGVISFLWGAWVILTPILRHATESALILGQLNSFPVFESALGKNSSSWMGTPGTLVLLFLGSVFSLIWLRFKRDAVSARDFVRELWVLVLLQLTFLTSSLLTSFGIYFVIWHSVSSLRDQISALDQLSGDAGGSGSNVRPSWRHYVRSALPYWLASVVAILLVLSGALPGFLSVPRAAIVFWGAILLTPPHLLVIGALHGRVQRAILK